jgi:hypothetical protein
MELQIELNGTDATEQNLLNLQDWIQNERIAGLQINRKFGSPKEGKMGLDPLTILTIFMTSPVIVEIVKSIYGWIRMRRTIELEIKINWDGKEIEVNTENISDIKELLDKIPSN